MAEDPGRKPSGVAATGGAGPVSPPSQIARDPRAIVSVPVRYRYQSFIDFIETQSMNISRSGMFLLVTETLPVGTLIDFELSLTDGFTLLRGKGEVARASTAPLGLGVRFVEIDEPSRKLLDRILHINTKEGKQSTVSLDFPAGAVAPPMGLKGATGVSGGLKFAGRDLSIQINPATLAYFTQNPLLNMRLGGFVVPGVEDVPLGTIFTVAIGDFNGAVLWTGKGKVVAKHDMRLGIRLTDIPKDALARLQTELARLASPGK
jgi:PilZ domain